MRGSRSFYLALAASLPATPKYNFRTSAARRRPIAVSLRTDRKQRLLSSYDSIVSRARPMRHPENQFSGVANPGHEQQDHRSAHNFPSRVSREPTIILLANQGSDVLSTIREQKHLLHHRSHCRYRHRPQSAPRVLAQDLPARQGKGGAIG